jgi:HlyD family secretion protein
MRWKTVFWAAALLAAAGGGFWIFKSLRGGGTEIKYRTAKVERGDLNVTIGATGTVEPEELVDVGAQVGGLIVDFGKDGNGKTVDYGSPVKAGDILALIDPALYESEVAKNEGQLQQSQANMQKAEADFKQLEAKLSLATNDWERAQKLHPANVMAAATYDTYKSAYEMAVANIAVGKAVILQTKAAVTQADASLNYSKRNLGYCTIRSPVDGIVVDRRVNKGQTVVSSMSAPSLFLIAKDLKKMQVWSQVNEADIGKIYIGQPVTFTVDAFQGVIFKGDVGKIRLNASMSQNVVTYTVEINTDNSSGKLLPYLTANVKFEIKNKKGVLLAPNQALRFTPDAEAVSPEIRASAAKEAAAETADGKNSAGKKDAAGGDKRSGKRRHGTLWTQDGKYLKPLEVRTGDSDGAVTEILADTDGGSLEGLDVVTARLSAEDAQSDATKNPFMPQIRRRR